jgi:AcrR family transcriptional regulator
MKTNDRPWGSAPRKRETKFPQKKEAVIRAAAALFRDRGYEGASLNDLAEILNITKPTIYYYVENKERLYLEIIRAAQDEILAFMKAAERSTASGHDKLRQIMIDYGLMMISDNGACLVRIPTAPFEPDSRVEVVKHIEEADRIIYRVLAEGERDGSLFVPDATVVLHTLFGSLNWVAYWAKSKGRLSPEALITTQVDVLLAGLRPRLSDGAGPPAAPNDAKTSTRPRARRKATK